MPYFKVEHRGVGPMLEVKTTTVQAQNRDHAVEVIERDNVGCTVLSVRQTATQVVIEKGRFPYTRSRRLKCGDTVGEWVGYDDVAVVNTDRPGGIALHFTDHWMQYRMPGLPLDKILLCTIQGEAESEADAFEGDGLGKKPER